MEGVLLLSGLLFLNFKWILSSEAVMSCSDHVRISYSPALVLAIHFYREVSEIFELIPYLDIFLSVQKNGEKSIGGTSIIDHLVGIVEIWVIVREGFPFFSLLHPLEQEDKAINRSIEVNCGKYFIWLSSSSSKLINSSTYTPLTPIFPINSVKTPIQN